MKFVQEVSSMAKNLEVERVKLNPKDVDVVEDLIEKGMSKIPPSSSCSRDGPGLYGVFPHLAFGL